MHFFYINIIFHQVLPETKGRSFEEIAADFRKAAGLGDPLLSPPKPPARPFLLSLGLAPFLCLFQYLLLPSLGITGGIVAILLLFLFVSTGIGPLYEWHGTTSDEKILSPVYILSKVLKHTVFLNF